ncbi:Lrp/AsnC family transcriptional regulator [Actinokineospora bangkokensis]|uniref:HTH asnC-type domain-containing protein n=1 Tax=Actinokineospora bangkokensis TaxID=1193682 RepID=A0A1Q9LD31_9PSEU|nr:Lrp/AsnC family transcriptional regulator [Actinokineospora bangkokensis]OLR89923.1 hypothetical protein BJP25_02695 [Actinokineospora bangkokensis]
MVDIDALDVRIVHALSIDGRAPFARVGEVLGVSDRTVARRYARLREGGVLRVVGAVDAARLGGARWLIRLHCQPGSALEVAAALARREDTRWVHLLSAGTEISASLQSWSPQERDDLLLQRLQNTAPVVSVTAHNVLQVYGGGPDVFGGFRVLDEAQVAALRPRLAAAPATDFADADRPLLRELSRDGRAPYPVLARAAGWSESTAARRVEALRAGGLVFFDVDVDAAGLGYHANCQLWAAVPPSLLEETGRELAAHPEVVFCAATTGPRNLVASVVCRDTGDLYRYLTRRIGALAHVREVEMSPIIRTVKRAGTVHP